MLTQLHALFSSASRRIVTGVAVSGLAAAMLLVIRAVMVPSASAWRPAGLKGETVHFIATGHTHPGLLFAATGTGVYRRDSTRAPWTSILHVPTVWAVALLSDDRTVLAADEEGYVDVSRDAGAHWRRHLVAAGGAYAVTAQPGNPGVLLAGAAGGLYRSQDGGIHWRHVLALPRSAGAALDWLPGSSLSVYAGAVAGDVGGKTQVYVSHDAGMHWRLLGRGLQSKAGIMSLSVGSGGAVYAGTMGNRIWTLPGGNASWRLIARGIPPGQHVSGIAIVPGTRPTLFAATLADGVFVSKDGGKLWSDLPSGLPDTDGGRIVLSVGYAPGERAAYAGTVDGIYRYHVR